VSIKFGPAGLGPVKEAIVNLEEYSRLGFKACEIAFTYGIYIKDKEAPLIKQAAEKLNIKLSIHAPYWINLNSKEKLKIKQSQKRILDCVKIGDKLGAETIVFHAGFYGKNTPEETYETIKNSIQEIQDEIKASTLKPKIAPETMGKINVFGTIEDISSLVKDTKCSFCIDFAHILARYKENKFDLIKEKFPYKSWHCHFSGIEYGEKGEKKHIKTPKESWQTLLKNLPKDKDIKIINESPDMITDSVEGLKLSKII
jgi:deoxyribonuclease IV